MSTPLAVLAGTVIADAFGLAAFLAVPHRSRPGAISFIGMTLSFAAMPVPMAILWTGGSPRLAFVLTVANIHASVAWIVLAFEYTGRGFTMTRRRIAEVLLLGFLTILGLVVGSTTEGMTRAVTFAANRVLQVTLFAAVGYGTFLVARSILRYDELSWGETLLLATAGSGLTTIWLIRVTTPELPVEPMQGPQLAILAWMAGTFLVAQHSYDVFETGPSGGYLARETIFDEMDQAAFITDREDGVLDCNENAVTLFGPSRDRMVGRLITDVLSVVGDNGRSTVTTEDSTSVTLNTMVGHRTFEITDAQLTSTRGDPIGRAYLLRDVTDARTHEQRLDVLNRVFRHTLRNDLDALDAFAETLAADGTVERVDTTDLAGRIRETATELAELGETVGRTERLLGRDHGERGPVDVVAVCHQVVEEIERSYPDAAVSVDADDARITVPTDRLVFEAALTEVVENAVEHNDEPTPQVTVSVERTDAGTHVAVYDNGPGIPAREREVLLDGEETPLRHGNGVGLWLVHWGMARLGGDLELADNQPRGTVVTLMLPRSERQSEDVAVV
jgi:signal transduction histidine kinase